MGKEQWVKEYYQDFGDVYEMVWNEQIHTGTFQDNDSLEIAVQRTNEKLSQQAGIKQGSTILTVGSGRGGTDRFLAKNFNAKIIGLDINPKQIEIAKSRARAADLRHQITYIQGSMTNLPVSDRSLDYLWVQESFFHCDAKEQAFLEFIRTLKPGGKIIFEDTGLGDKAAEKEVIKKFGSRVNIQKLLTLEEYKNLFKKFSLKIIEEKDETTNLAKTYQAIVKFIESHKEQLAHQIPSQYLPKLHNNFGFKDSLKLAEQRKLACYTFILEK